MFGDMKPGQVKRLCAQVFQPCKSGEALYFESLLNCALVMPASNKFPYSMQDIGLDNMVASVLIQNTLTDGSIIFKMVIESATQSPT